MKILQLHGNSHLLVTGLLLVVCSILLVNVGLGQTRPPEQPLTLRTTEELIKLKSPLLVTLIQRRGIDFSADPCTLERLEKLGATKSAIAALQRLRGSEDDSRKRVSILVAEFVALDAPTRSLTQTLIERIRTATRVYPDITIGALGEAVTVEQGDDYAKEKGRQRGADIVIWGWYTGSDERLRVSVHFEVIDGPYNLALIQSVKTFDVPVSEIKSFDIQIQTPLSGEMSCLTLLTLGLARSQALDFDGAIETFTKALSLSADSSTNTMVNPAAIYFYRAASLLGKYFFRFEDETTRAVDDLNAVLKLEPKNVFAYKMLASVSQLKGDWETARLNLEKAVLISPDDPEMLFSRGLLYAANELSDLANKDFKRALEIVATGGTDSYPNILQIQLHIQLNNFSLAESEINHALEGETDVEAQSFLHFFKATIYAHAEKYQDVIKEANEILRCNQDFLLAYLLRAGANSELGNFGPALEDADYLVKIRPTNAVVISLRAEIKRDKGDWKNSIADYNRAIELDPHLISAYQGRGEAYSALKDYKNAIADFDRVLKNPSGRESTYLDRGLAHNGANEYVAALADYSEYIRRFPDRSAGYIFRASTYDAHAELEKALTDYTTAVSISGKDANAAVFYGRGDLYQRKGDLEKASADFSRAIELQSTAGNHLRRGIILFLLKKYEPALRDFDQAIKLDPKLHTAWLDRGITHERLGHWNQAIDAYSEFIKQQPDSILPFAFRGFIYKTKGDLNNALKDYSEAIRRKPDEFDWYIQRADIYERTKDLDKAITDYSKVIQIAPTSLFYHKRGVLNFDAGKLDDAITDFQESIRLDASNIDSHLALGLTYEAKGDFVKALTFFDQCVTLRPENHKCYLIRGNAYSRQSDWAHALADYDNAIKLKPDNDSLYFKRAGVNRKSGDLKNAVADYSRAIQLNNKSPEYFFSRASTEMMLEEFGLAVADLDKAILLNSKEPRYYHVRGIANNNQRKYDRGLADVNLALKLRPTWDAALFTRALIYSAKGDKKRAGIDLRTCMRVSTQEKTRQQAQVQLEKLKAGTVEHSVIRVQ